MIARFTHGTRTLRQLFLMFFFLTPLLFADGDGAAPVAQRHSGGEASLHLPYVGSVSFAGGVDGHTLLLGGLVVCALGLLFGFMAYRHIKGLPVHQAMREVSELIYETCKTYLFRQGRFLLVLWAFISAIVLVYFAWLAVTGVDAVTGEVQRG